MKGCPFSSPIARGRPSASRRLPRRDVTGGRGTGRFRSITAADETPAAPVSTLLAPNDSATTSVAAARPRPVRAHGRRRRISVELVLGIRGRLLERRPADLDVGLGVALAAIRPEEPPSE